MAGNSGLKWSRWSCIWPRWQYSDYQMILIVSGVILCALVLGGCSHSTISSIYLLSVYTQYLAFRVGMFSVCARAHAGPWFCSKDISHLARSLKVDRIDLLQPLYTAVEIRSSIVFPHLIIVAIILAAFAFGLLAKFPRWHAEVNEDFGSDGEVEIQPFAPKSICLAVFNLLFVACIFLLVDLLWQVTVSNALGTIADNEHVQSTSSAIPKILLSLGIVLLFVSAVLILQYTLSIKLLNEDIDNYEGSQSSEEER